MIFDIKVKEHFKKIADNMLLTRPIKEVSYRPFIKMNGVSKKILSFMTVDLDEIYPDAKIGDFAYVKTKLSVPFEKEIAVSVKGNVKCFFNGEEVSVNEKGILELYADMGKNELVFKCEKNEEGFFVSFVPSLRMYPGMWATDYLYYIKTLIPIEEYSLEEGVSISCLNSEKIAFPVQTEAEDFIDFEKLYACEEGEYAYLLTYAKCDTIYEGNEEFYINGRKTDSRILKKGDSLLICCKRGKTWGFTLKNRENFHIPFLESNRKAGDEFLLLGAFATPNVPEIQFKKPYEGRFWRLSDGSYLRPYLDTYFYGQWFYALMVGEFGLYSASRLLGKDLMDYFAKSLGTIVDFFELMRYEAKEFGCPSFLGRSIKLDNLDSIGSIGMNLCEFYKINPTKELREILEIMANAAMNNIPRFPDGAFYRNYPQMWADDIFMSCPFLVRMGEITGDTKYFDECALQIRGFKKRLYMKDKNIFSHIYFLEDEQMSGVPWGRGNGWIFFALSEVLTYMPKNHPDFCELLQTFKDFAGGIRSFQSEDGMYHQVIDLPESYKETSCTAMFGLGMLRGVKNGWLDADYLENVKKAINGILSTAVDEKGNIYGVCLGSECSYDPAYYAKLGTAINDDHGTGVILTLLTEFLELSAEMKEIKFDVVSKSLPFIANN